jgi:hypothetical protein
MSNPASPFRSIVKLTTLVLVVSFAALSAPVHAQGEPTDPEKARLRLGPLALDPTVGLTNFGVDANVFNSPSTGNPQRDVTMTITPVVDWSMRLGRSHLFGVFREDLVYYQEFASERAANTSNWVALRVPLNRLTMTAASTFSDKRDRPGFEIDARSQHSVMDYEASAELRAFGKTFVALSGKQSTVTFDQDEIYLDISLRHELNRRVSAVGLSVRHEITPVTSLTLEVERGSDRFKFSSLRDSDSTSLTGGVAFRPRTLLSGSAALGDRNFRSLALDVPDFSGLVARADVAARILGSMRLGVQVERNLQYSYTLAQPYYLMTGGRVSLTRALYGPTDISGRVGSYTMEYRGLLSMATPLPQRTDLIRSFGGTIGYRFGQGMRLGFNIDKQKRVSKMTEREFDGFRYGTSVTYDF